MAGHRRLRCTCDVDGCRLTGDVIDLSDPRPPKPRVEVHVVIPAETLIGAADLPGVLRRLGVVDPDTARRLATDATWRALLTLDGTPIHLGRARPAGEVVDSPDGAAGIGGRTSDDVTTEEHARGAETGSGGEYDVPAALRRAPVTDPGLCVDAPDPERDPSVLRYTPSESLAALVRDRDGHCRFPGCTVPAQACDLDHVTPFNHHNPRHGGWTTRVNLACLCRHHHRAKTTGVWTVRMDPDGTQHWTGPTDQTTTTRPDGLPPSVGEHGPPLPSEGRPGCQPPPPPWTSHWGRLDSDLDHALTQHLELRDHARQRRQWQNRDHPPPPRPQPPPEDDPPPF